MNYKHCFRLGFLLSLLAFSLTRLYGDDVASWSLSQQRPDFRALPSEIRELTVANRISNCLIADRWVVALVEECTLEPKGVFSRYLMSKCRCVSILAYNLDSTEWRTLEFGGTSYASVRIIRAKSNSIAILTEDPGKSSHLVVWALERNTIENRTQVLSGKIDNNHGLLEEFIPSCPHSDIGVKESCELLFAQGYMWDFDAQANAPFRAILTSPERILRFEPKSEGFEVSVSEIGPVESYVKLLDDNELNARFKGDRVKKVLFPRNSGFSKLGLFLAHFESGMIRLFVIDSRGMLENFDILVAQASFDLPVANYGTDEPQIFLQMLPDKEDGDSIVIAQLRWPKSEDEEIGFGPTIIRKYPSLLNHSLIALSDDMKIGYSYDGSSIIEWNVDSARTIRQITLSE